MRIERLNVQGFGQLQGLQLELKEDVTVLFGPNGAGKSTLLGFVRAMLFGIPSRSYGAQRYEPTGGGTHGGTITIRDSEARSWFIERYAKPPEGTTLSGRAGDRLRISRSDPEGGMVELSDGDLRRELLGGMSKEMFNQLFAVTLSELQEVSALASDDLSSYLFHAGIGGGTAVLQGEKKILQELDKLYRPRGRSQEIYGLTQELERIELQAGAAKSLLPRYESVTLELKELEDLLYSTAAEYEQCVEEEASLSKAIACRPAWYGREAILRELADLPERPAFPVQAKERWNRLQEDKARELPELNELKRKIAAMELEIRTASADFTLLDQEQAILQLERRLPAYESRRQEAVELASEASRLEQKLERCLESIHPDWTRDLLRKFTGTIGERETVRRTNTEFSAYEREMEALYQERLKLEREATAAGTELDRIMDRLAASREEGNRDYAPLRSKDRSETQALWNEISGLIDQARGEQALLREEGLPSTEVTRSARPAKKLSGWLAGAVLLTVVIPLLLWLIADSLWGSLVSAIVLLGIDLYLVSKVFNNRQQSKDIPRKAQESRRSLSATPAGLKLSQLLPKLVHLPVGELGAASRLSGYSVPFKAEGGLDGYTLTDEEERALRRLMEKWMLWSQRQETLEEQAAEQRRKLHALDEALAGLERELTRKEEIFAAQSQAWERWLAERELAPELSPEAALEVFRLAEQGREWLEQLEAVTLKLEGVRHEIASFESDCRALNGIGGSAEDEVAAAIEHHALPGKLHRALAELEQQQKQREAASRLEEKKARLEEELEKALDRLGLLEQAERHLLDESGAEDGEQLLRIAEEEALRGRLKEELRQVELELHLTIGSEHGEQVRQLLKSREEQELSVLLAEARDRLKQAETARQGLVERKGRLLQERESLEAQGLRDNWQQQLAEQEAALHDAVDRYAALALCHELIGRVRKIYEQERQPQVLKTASAYLKEMTGGLYSRILVKMGTQELMVEHRDYGPIGSSYLSRGTAEQTYLAMRLALSDAVSGSRSLPLLLDDLFVNFDRGRLQGALKVLGHLSGKQQIIFMTCHDHVLQEIREHFSSVDVIEIH